ncbi:class I SAM-dependent methyltransferase [Phototrophicus methaneseepsis]|uniref:Class I SAM-dependent methyltransferase n=1 Tax=Phototrophicus methaneseepsis TaxID=2710758 RepID=A0A7S8IEQ5_9CHLR|nr:class I SAM-dependent methyltransferase [Phototrophicus methaneseepsis]QPC83940.1 class I SAM-dependent methyltransferase [Phototrophicus methaneseepsis]
MSNQDTDIITTHMLATGQHYYSNGYYLREKHRLAGHQYVHWTLNLIPNWSGSTVLDAGGGWGRYLWSLIDQGQIDVKDAVLTDISEGMLLTSQEEARQRAIILKTTVCNIESLPFAQQKFNIVMANKVLYHVADRLRGVRELARVLKPDGTLLATTNSDKITATVVALHYQALDRMGIAYEPEPSSPFSMENGADLLATQFRTVKAFYYEDEALIYNAAEMRATYNTIGRYRNVLARHDIAEAVKQALPEVVEQLAQAIIDRDGVLRSPSLMGAFVCTDPVQMIRR